MHTSRNYRLNGLYLSHILSNLINAFCYGMNDDFLLICSLVEDYGDKKRWIFICEDETIINLPGLVKVLNKYDARKVCCKERCCYNNYFIVFGVLLYVRWFF